MVLNSFIDNNELKPDPMDISIKIERDCPLSIETDTEEEEAEIKEKSYEQKMCTAVSAELGARVKILLVFLRWPFIGIYRRWSSGTKLLPSYK